MSLESDIKSIVKSMDLELYDTAITNEHEETIFRVSVISPEFIDGKRKGVTMDNYVELTHLISPLLDVTPPVSGEYRLEVGSTGIERKLVSLDNFKKSIGEKVAILTVSKDKIKGLLTKVDGSKLYIQTDDEIQEIDFSDVKKAKTYFEW